jgi:hypothetical protein
MTIKIYIGKGIPRNNRVPVFDAWLDSPDGRHLTRSSEPFFASARVLLADGHPATETLEMYGLNHPPMLRMSGKLGKLAKLTVQDSVIGQPRIRKLKPGVAA